MQGERRLSASFPGFLSAPNLARNKQVLLIWVLIFQSKMWDYHSLWMHAPWGNGLKFPMPPLKSQGEKLGRHKAFFPKEILDWRASLFSSCLKTYAYNLHISITKWEEMAHTIDYLWPALFGIQGTQHLRPSPYLANFISLHRFLGQVSSLTFSWDSTCLRTLTHAVSHFHLLSLLSLTSKPHFLWTFTNDFDPSWPPRIHLYIIEPVTLGFWIGGKLTGRLAPFCNNFMSTVHLQDYTILG